MVLLYAVVAALVAAGMVSVAVTLASTASDRSVLKRDELRARYLAEGAIEHAKKQMLNAIANWNPPPGEGVATIDGTDVPYTITETGYNEVIVEESGIQTTKVGFLIESAAEAGASTHQAFRIVNAEATPIFQFAVFYTEDLEVFPGPNMTLGGRVHTNGDMFLGSAGNTLTMNTNYVRSVGSMYRHRKDNPSAPVGSVRIREWVKNPFDSGEPTSYVQMNSKAQMQADGVTTISGYDSNFVVGYDSDDNGSLFDEGDYLPWNLGAMEYWDEPEGYSGGHGQTVMTSEHGITEAVTPQVQSIAMFEEQESGDYVLHADGYFVPAPTPGAGTHGKGFFHEQSDLSILALPDGSWQAFDGDGDPIPSGDLAGVVTIGQTFDAREADGTANKVPVIEIDIEALNQATDFSGRPYFPENGLLYASSYGTSEDALAGVRLKNGAELAGPLTVVSEGSLYVQGDYNTIGKKGAAVIGDAVNLLSNAWDDSKDPGELPDATQTTFNLAMITGNQETTPGTDSTAGPYNGGLENLPRFHEDWAGVVCNITGSFVNTWQSQYATGQWVYGVDRYTAPNRNWNYDTAFNDVDNLPPFTPIAVSAKDVVSW